MKFLAIAALIFAFSLSTVPTWAESPGILTFSGSIAQTNRGPVTADDRGMFSYHDIAFDTGYRIDRATLAAMPQTSYVDDFPGSEGTYRGPLLAEVLTHVGGKGDRLVLTGLDGYAVEIDRSEIETHNPILAIELDGSPLAIGDLGPVKLVFPKVGDADVDKKLRSKSVYALFHISVEGN